MVVERSVEAEENEKVVVDEKPVLAVETYNLDNKTLHNDWEENEIVVVVAVERANTRLERISTMF